MAKNIIVARIEKLVPIGVCYICGQAILSTPNRIPSSDVVMICNECLIEDSEMYITKAKLDIAEGDYIKGTKIA